MCLLHLRHDHVRCGAFAQNSQAQSRRNHSRHGWQHLPLLRLPANHRGHRACREGGRRVSDPFTFEPGMEPERYELDAPLPYRFSFARRSFFKSVGAGIIVLGLLDKAASQEAGRRRSGGRSAPQDIGAWLHIGEDGQIKVFTGKVEVGQNIRTSLTQAVAEELHAPTRSIHVVMADTQLTPYDAGTFGSRTTPDMARTLRRVAAAARELLIDLAAEHWKAERAALKVAEGKVTHADGRAIEFGKLTDRKSTRLNS